VKFGFDNNLEHEGKQERRDDLTLRIAAEVIDVKPNGQLILEAKKKIQNDEELQDITLTGACRGEDVTADNTVLSTQLLNLNINVQNKGAVRDASSRGWFSWLWDATRAF
jgi:flagellar L-ring protein precursor FlgH